MYHVQISAGRGWKDAAPAFRSIDKAVAAYKRFLAVQPEGNAVRIWCTRSDHSVTVDA